MLIVIEQFVDSAEAQDWLAQLRAASWRSGLATAGAVAGTVKDNLQLDDADPVAQQLRTELRARLLSHPDVVAACVPAKICAPRFNCYQQGGHYGTHIDSALMRCPDSQQLIRSDISGTLFLTPPDSYSGGELNIETQFGLQQVKLDAGDLVLYDASSLHQVAPVTHGQRISSFFWMQSLIRSGSDRELLYALDQQIQQARTIAAVPATLITELTGSYHNLLRRFAAE